MKRKYLLSIILALALVGGLGYYYGGHQTPAGQAPLQQLTKTSDLRDAFNAAQGDVRILLLLSPT
jgi:hypothetical protein